MARQSKIMARGALLALTTLVSVTFMVACSSDADESTVSASAAMEEDEQSALPGLGDHCNSGQACASKGDGVFPTCCGAQCVDMETDINNCGDCNRRCARDKVCRGGACILVDGYVDGL
jgi:hypothetical protein